MGNSRSNEASSRFQFSALELEAGILDAVYDNDLDRLQRYLSYMQKNLLGSRKSKKRKDYQKIIKYAHMLAMHYGRDKALFRIMKMPAKGNMALLNRNRKQNIAVNQLKFFRAIRKNNFKQAEATLKQIPKSKQREILSKGLGLACYFGHENLIVKFLEKGADINYNNGDTISWIVREGRADIIKNLVEKHGVDVTAVGSNILIGAVAGYNPKNAKKHTKTVKYLIDLGVDIHTNHNEALTIAIDTGSSDVVQLLLEAGADMDIAFSRVKSDVEKNIEKPELLDKFNKWWQNYEAIYIDIFNKYFEGKDYQIDDMRRIIDNKRGITGFAVAIKAGKIDEVLKKIIKNGQQLKTSDIRNMAGGKISGVELFNNRNKLSDLFNTTIWYRRPDAIKELWHDLPENDKKQVDLKQLFLQTKSANLRNYIKNNRKNRGPKK